MRALNSCLVFFIAFIFFLPEMQAQSAGTSRGDSEMSSASGFANVDANTSSKYKQYIISRVNNSDVMSHGILVYPNPVQNILHLNVERMGPDMVGKVSYNLEDERGQVLISGRADEKITNIDMNDIEDELVFLKVNADNQKVKVYKIEIK